MYLSWNQSGTAQHEHGAIFQKCISVLIWYLFLLTWYSEFQGNEYAKESMQKVEKLTQVKYIAQYKSY